MFNKTLKFSFAHVFAFLAIIAVMYITFMGATYSRGGDFVWGSIVAGASLVSLLVMSYAIQLLKASESKFDTRILWERFMVLVFIVIGSLIFYFPFSHFWAVVERSADIEQQFSRAIQQSKALFDNYESYTAERRGAYAQRLEEIAAAKESEDYRYGYFIEGLESHQIANSLLSMDIQQRGDNYTALSTSAHAWIEESSQEVSAYNVFLLGNIDQIQQAVSAWHRQLQVWTERPMLWEGGTMPFDVEGTTIGQTLEGLERVRQAFSEQTQYPNTMAWITAVLLAVLLSLPYHIQPRYSKAQKYYGFWRMGQGAQANDSELWDDKDAEHGKKGRRSSFTIDI